MMAYLHFLRPWWLCAVFPLIGLFVLLWQQKSKSQAWEAVCDPQLLAHLSQKKPGVGSRLALSLLSLSMVCMMVALSGPAWVKFPIGTYTQIQAHVLLLDMSDTMLNTDLSPDRLSRAKFKLQDLFARKGWGQFGLIVYTDEPFVVSPLTDDGQTIASLLPSLRPDIMPIPGDNLEGALKEARQLIRTAGYQQGDILVLTANSPSLQSIDLVRQLAAEGIDSSIMAMTADSNLNPLFQRFAQAGSGLLLPYTPDSTDMDRWLKTSKKRKQFAQNKQDNIPVWRDEGRWFLLPALAFFLPVFRRGWQQKVTL
ncbi:MAG: VWA domain-containing protein [Legionella sp.]|nr:VWA domain-containing protein [Legionella sp.]